MKKTLSTYEIADTLFADENAGWSRKGAFALAEYFEEYEEDTGEEMELDVVAVRCDFSEYDSLTDWVTGHWGQSYEDSLALMGIDATDDEEEAEAILEYISDRGTLIEFDGGIIVSAF